ncbi:Polycomb group RING finger protein 3 [Anabarilius grahami]|uniref:Polycomb group RING finger protein 3 n=1 Tax=Anabarilius grahami TaxID=495550 RepID=A0A3N0YX40_ANAGA|nr:Polycomb group RING finger protein 3 [Anabarilius grahami]
MLTRKIKLWDINAHITCRLCEGYLIDATTVTECLHTFCRSCLVKYLEENNTCPTCRIVIHQSHPLQYIGHDRTMQDIVYKLVPGLQEAEMKKQREFYQKLGMEVPGDIKGELCNMKTHLDSQRNGDLKSEDPANKEAGEEKAEEDNDYHRSDEQVSICLECNSSKLRGLKRKWIRCSAQATVLHLKKFIAKKLNLTSFNELDILCNEEILGKDHTLKFVVVTRWRFKTQNGSAVVGQKRLVVLAQWLRTVLRAIYAETINAHTKQTNARQHRHEPANNKTSTATATLATYGNNRFSLSVCPLYVLDM